MVQYSTYKATSSESNSLFSLSVSKPVETTNLIPVDASLIITGGLAMQLLCLALLLSIIQRSQGEHHRPWHDHALTMVTILIAFIAAATVVALYSH